MIQFKLKLLLNKVENAGDFAILRADLIQNDGAVFAEAAGRTTCSISGISGDSPMGDRAALDDWARAARRSLLHETTSYLALPAGAETLENASLQSGGNWAGLTEGRTYQIFELLNPVLHTPGEPAPITAPTVVTAPSITGTATVGQTLTAVAGIYTGTPAITRQWLRNGTAISGATGATYLQIAADQGANISLRETATNAGGSVQSTSAAVGPVAAAPVNPTAPLQITDWTWTTGLAASQIALAITAPGNGGSAITGYDYSLDGGTTVVALTGASPWVLTMAAAGTGYAAVVRARNAVGAGPWSVSKTATSGAAAATIHVIAVTGQSNAVGRAIWDNGASPAALMVHQVARTGTISGGADGAVVAWGRPLDHWDPTAGQFGLDTQFAIDYIAANPGVDLVFIPGAKGGTGFGTGLWGVGNTLSEDVISRVNTYMAAHPTAQLRGILWHQGEASAGDAAYQTRLDAQFADFRSRMTGASATTPVVVGEIGLFVSSQNAANNTIQNIIRNTPNRLAYTACVYTGDLLDKGDVLHFNAAAVRAMGTRYNTALAVAAANASPAVAAPGIVDGVTVAAGASGELVVSWLAAADHGSAVTGYTVEYKMASASTWTAGGTGTGLTRTLTGLTNASTYDVRVKATNTVGTGPVSLVKQGAPASGAGAVVITGAGFASAVGTGAQTRTVTTAGGTVIFGIVGRTISDYPTSVTIGGITPTQIFRSGGASGNGIAWYYAVGVPAGAVTVAYTTTASRSGVHAWSVTGASLSGITSAMDLTGTGTQSGIAVAAGSALLTIVSGVSIVGLAYSGAVAQRQAMTDYGDTFGTSSADGLITEAGTASIGVAYTSAVNASRAALYVPAA